MLLTRWLNHTTHSITLAALILGGASLASRVLGLLRDRLLTATFGAGTELDAYYAAFRLPDFLYNLLILGALSAAFIPLFTANLQKSHVRAWKFMNTSLSTLGFLFFIISLIGALGAPLFTKIIAPGFSGEKLTLTIRLTQIMMVSPLLMGLSAAIGGALQALKKFLIYAFAPLMYNLGIIIGVVFLVPIWGPLGLALGVLLGAALHLLIQLPVLLSSGYRPALIFNWHDSDVRNLLKLMGPRTLALAAAQINFVIITILASKLSAGSVAIFNLANNIQSLPIGIIAVSYAVAAFPLMSEYAANDNPDGLAKIVGQTVRMVLLWLIPISVLFITLRAQWVRIILGAEKFSWAATIATADTLGFFALGLIGQGLVHIFARAFYALQDTKTPAWVSVATNALGIILALILMRRWGVAGLAFAFSVNVMLNTIILWLLLRHRLGSLHDQQTLNVFYKLAIAGLLMILIVQGLKAPLASVVNMHTFWGIFTQTMAAALAGLIGFTALGLILRVQEIQILIDSLKSRAQKILRVLPIDITDIDSAH